MARLILFLIFIAQFARGQVVDDHLIFPIEKNQISLNKDKITYDFGRSESFQFSSFDFRYEDIGAQLATIAQRTTEFYNSTYLHHRVLGLKWPLELIEYGDIEIYPYGAEDPSHQFGLSEKTQREWWGLPERLKEEKRLTWGKTKLKFMGEAMPFSEVSYGIHPVPTSLRKVIRKPFQYCVTEENPSSWVKFCSPFLTTNTRGKIILYHKLLRDKYEYRVNGRPAKVAGKLKFQHKFDFEMNSRNGFSFQVRGTPIEAEISQVLQNGDKLEVLGSGVAPHRAKSLDGSFRLLEKIGWRDTILPEKKYWKLKLDKKKPFIPAMTAGAQFIGYEIEGKRGFPLKVDRLLLDEPLIATYSRRYMVRGTCKRNCNLRSLGPDSVFVNGKKFEWEVELPNKQELNYNQIGVVRGENQWFAQSEIFRASSTEFSLRGSGILTEGGVFSALGEISASKWFEDLFGWQSRSLSKQRWGVAARYFQTVSDIQIQSNLAPRSWSTLNTDFRYRFTPGVWGLRESLGLNLSFQQTNLGDLSQPLVGAGLFWAKSMPEIFDRFLRWLPYMNYPKWVDMEFVVYPVSLSTEATTDLMYNLNFHGKIMWAPWFFGELGFGIRRVSVIDNINLERFGFFSAYLTAGLGIQF